MRQQTFDSARVTLADTISPQRLQSERRRQWRVPICLRYGIGKSIQRECFELTSAESVMELGVEGCPDWLHPNADEQGYYRWRIPTVALTDLATVYRDRLSVAERVALPGHLSALFEAGELDVATFLDALRALAKDPHPLVTKGIISGLRLAENAALSERGVAPCDLRSSHCKTDSETHRAQGARQRGCSDPHDPPRLIQLLATPASIKAP